jgi:predicted Zn-dependent protease
MGLRRFLLAIFGLVVVVGLSGLAVWRWYDSNPARVFARAEQAFHAGHYDEAEVALTRLLALKPPAPVDRFLRAEVDAKLNRPGQALAELERIPDDHPLAPLAQLFTGQLEIRAGRTRPAEAAFLAAIKLLPRAPQPRKELVYIYNIQHRQAELDAQLAALLELDSLDFQRILHWTKTRNTVWNAAGDLPALEQYVAADPGDRWSRLALAEGLRRLDRRAEAEAVLAVLPQSDSEAQAQRALLAIERGDFAGTETILSQTPGDHPTLARLRGQLALHRRDGGEAARQFRIALCGDPLDRSAASGLGTALRLAGKREEAQPYLDAVRQHDALWALVARAATAAGERDPQLPAQIGAACAAIGRKHEARAWLKLAVERDPLNTQAQAALFDLEHGKRIQSTSSLPAAADRAGASSLE